MRSTIMLAVVATTALSSAAFAQTVGVSWSNFQEERWKTDEAAIVGALEDAGATYISADAQSSSSKQLSDVEALIAQGVDALIILAQDSAAIGPAVPPPITRMSQSICVSPSRISSIKGSRFFQSLRRSAEKECQLVVKLLAEFAKIGKGVDRLVVPIRKMDVHAIADLLHVGDSDPGQNRYLSMIQTLADRPGIARLFP